MTIQAATQTAKADWEDPQGLAAAGPADAPTHPTAASEVTGAATSVSGGATAEPGSHRRLAVNAIAGGIANVTKIGIQVVMLPLMAHLLGPSEFGLYAMVLPTVAFFMILADGGLAASLAREATDSSLVWSTAFWFVMAVGVGLAAIVSVWGFILAPLAHEPRLAALMPLLSISLLMIAASALPSASLTRQGRLAVFAAADVSSTVIAAGIAIALAASGAGAASLAIQYVTYYTLRALILNRAAFVRPRLEFRFSTLAGHLSTGSALLGGKLADFFGRLVENLLYGRTFGAAGLGLYTFSNQAPRFICEAASGPLWAALFSHALRTDEARLERTHIHLARLLSLIIFPVAALISATAPELLDLVLGHQWAGAAPLLAILVPAYALNVVGGQSGAVLLAKGRGRMLFATSFGLTIGRVTAVAIGAWIGETGVAIGIAGALTLYSLAMLAAPGHAHRGRDLVVAMAPAIAASCAAGLAAYAAMLALAPGLVSLILEWLAGGAAYVAVIAALQFRQLRSDIAAIVALAMRPRARSFE